MTASQTPFDSNRLVLPINCMNGLHLLGERLNVRLSAVDCPFESAFLVAGRELPKTPEELAACQPDLMLFFDGFSHLQCDPQIYLSLGNSLTPQRNVDFALYGVGMLVLRPTMFKLAEDASLEGKTWEPQIGELKMLASLMEQLARKKWGVDSPSLAVRFADLNDPGGFEVRPHQVEMCFQLSAEVSKEVYMERMQILSKELEFANRHVVMSSLGGAMKKDGKETLQ